MSLPDIFDGAVSDFGGVIDFVSLTAGWAGPRVGDSEDHCSIAHPTKRMR
jgi:hypothetical protein